MNCALPPPAEACSRAPPALEQTALDLTRAPCARCSPIRISPSCASTAHARPLSRRAAGGVARSSPFADFDWCRRLAKLVGNVTRQRVDESSPLLSAWLPSGERVQIILPPATTSGCVAITIRRPAAAVWSIEELASRGVFRGAAGGSAPQDTDAELLRLLRRARLPRVHASGGQGTQEHPGIRGHRLGQDHLDQGADPRDSGRRAAGDDRGCAASWRSRGIPIMCGCTTARATRGWRA